MIRLSRLGLLTLGLSACSASPPDRGFLARVDSTPTGTASAPTTPVRGAGDERSSLAILALPQEAARVRGGLSERRYANGWRQSISLDRVEAAKGWNELTIDIRTDDASNRDGVIPMGKPTQDGVRREISTRFPATQMRIVTRPMQNALGPFGLAIGAGEGGMRCAFAWQWVDDLRALGTSEAGGGRAKPLPASIRLRLCRAGVTADQLAGWFERLEFTGPANVERVAEVARSGGGVAAGGDLHDPPSTLESAIAPDVPAKVRPADAAKRRAARKQRAAPGPVGATASISPASGTPRYLAPVSGTSVHAGQTASAAPAASRLDPSLPAQAYYGPSAGR